KFLEQTTIYPTEPRRDVAGAERRLYRLVQKHNVRAITIGNGTASRETDAFVREFLRKYHSGEPLGVRPPKPESPAAASPASEASSVETLVASDEQMEAPAEASDTPLIQDGSAGIAPAQDNVAGSLPRVNGVISEDAVSAELTAGTSAAV